MLVDDHDCHLARQSMAARTRKLCYRNFAKMTAQWAPDIWVPWKFSAIPMSTATFPNIFHGLLFWLTVWMCVENVKSVAFTRSRDNRGTPKNLASPWICPCSLFSKWALVRMHPMNVPVKVRSFTCSWVNRGYPKIGVVPRYAHARGGRIGSGWYRSKERWWVSIGRPYP